ncbi:hypothetical protein [Mangrovitalea sediminis]|uniref:hypothetical protein n=1 Tax=Mangrovitalea sediminis TaxID=1982043 RepID=UPI000BE53452|nr:hypothetical protein [Mangrovitalea sediminis]
MSKMQGEPAPLLSPALTAFMQQGLSISLASRDIRHVPSLTRCLACRVLDDATVVLFLLREQALDLLRDLQKCRRLAVVFSRPLTHQTIQIKGELVEVRPCEAEEHPLIERQLTRIREELVGMGFPDTMLRTFFQVVWENVDAVRFLPDAVFEQTPGPRAGHRMENVP